jgi:hypothetical protein
VLLVPSCSGYVQAEWLHSDVMWYQAPSISNSYCLSWATYVPTLVIWTSSWLGLGLVFLTVISQTRLWSSSCIPLRDTLEGFCPTLSDCGLGHLVKFMFIRLFHYITVSPFLFHKYFVKKGSYIKPLSSNHILSICWWLLTMSFWWYPNGYLLNHFLL